MGLDRGQTLQLIGMYRGQTLQLMGMYRGQTLQLRGMYRGQTLHINLYCTTIGYHTDRTFHVMRNVQGQTHIKDNFNFVQ